MSEFEFLSILREALTGTVPDMEIENNLNYYRDYIERELAAGKSEQQIFEELGDPRLIAKTLADTYGRNNKMNGTANYTIDEDGAASSESSGYTGGYEQRNRRKDSLLHRILSMLLMIFVLVIVFYVGGFAISFLLRFILPFGLIVYVIYSLVRSRK
ncbi:DUF1700 domain-containing protein [Anaerolentibacter hominis]|uniref:DUF1700 domain-containing protein n=1 Tax=Anaerolentibacter hominis TaxID=3079009 RepID=UPI0031B89990